ncbi:MAG: response regulator [Chloroflexi bacterium]|nr:response regulator [Chloroflexota bacterium]
MTRILVIEDDTDLRQNLVDLLELEEYEVFSGADGEEGLTCARECLPDLIVCDIMMPKLDGYGVLKELRADPNCLVIPVIFLTAKTDRQSVRMGMELGADDYLTKPFTQQELLRSIQTQLSKRTAIKAALRWPAQQSDAHAATAGDQSTQSG